MAKYFLIKQAGYGHGLFWLGNNLAEGKRQADIAAQKDCDDYHEWNLHEYVKPDSATDYEGTKEQIGDIVYVGNR